MKKLLVIFLLLSLLIPTTAFAAKPCHTYDHGITCDLVWGRAINTSKKAAWGYGYIKAQPQGESTPIIVLPGMRRVAPGESYYLSWGPPDGFVGTVRVWVTFFGSPPGYEANEYLECHKYSAKRKMSNDCDGWELYASIRDYGAEIDREHLASGIWINPYIRELAKRPADYDKFYTVTLPDESTVRLKTPGQIKEPKGCTVPVDPEYGASIFYDGCDSYCAVVMPYQEGATIFYPNGPCGEWQDILELEEVTISFVIHQPDGSEQTHEIIAIEPEECFYGLCSMTTTSYGEWSAWESAGAGKGEVRQRTVIVYDARIPEKVCDSYIEKDYKCTDLFIMWLLEGTHPDANGILQCYVVSPTHPGVVRYQRICWPCLYPDFVASNAMGGYVDSCDNWTLDYARLYWRKSVGELLAMNARHAAGIYYPIVCEGCE